MGHVPNLEPAQPPSTEIVAHQSQSAEPIERSPRYYHRTCLHRLALQRRSGQWRSCGSHQGVASGGVRAIVNGHDLAGMCSSRRYYTCTSSDVFQPHRSSTSSRLVPRIPSGRLSGHVIYARFADKMSAEGCMMTLISRQLMLRIHKCSTGPVPSWPETPPTSSQRHHVSDRGVLATNRPRKVH